MSEAGVIDENDQHVGRTLGGRSCSMGGNLLSGSLAS